MGKRINNKPGRGAGNGGKKQVMLHRIKDHLKPAKKDGNTAYWLAKETGISYNSLHKYLNNTTEPSLTNLKRISDALGVSGKDLLNF